MAKNKSYEDLQVWQQAIELAVAVYHLTKAFPEDKKFGLISQMRRAAYSIGSNIAEGCSRNGANEFQQFLDISQGSLGELKTQCIIAYRISIMPRAAFDDLICRIDVIGRMLNALQNALRVPLTSN